MEYLIEYGMFLAKAATLVIAIVLVIGAVAAASQRQRRDVKKGTLKVTRLNEHYEDMRDTIREEVLDKEMRKQLSKQEKKREKEEHKQAKRRAKKQAADSSKEGDAADGDLEERKRRVYVLNFKGSISADEVESLREEITTVLSLADARDEILLRLESPGGMVHAYGLAASQLQRIRNSDTQLTICVDKVAASGGYMMACLADKLVAAPFAFIGSVGVLVQLPNFNRLLDKNHIDYEMISAGEYKRTLSTFGEITEKGRQKVKEEVEDIHQLFKGWIKEHRPSVDVDKIATGETWVGTQAKERYMVDEIRTSDECIAEACANAEVFEVEYEFKKTLQDRLGFAVSTAVERVVSRLLFEPRGDKYY